MRARLAAALLLVAASARAADYGVFIDVETEDQLLDLLSAGEIDESTYNVLQDLLNDGVDINSADREELYALPNLTYEEVDKILRYRESAGPIADLTGLVASSILTGRKVLAITPFILMTEPKKRFDVHGRLRYRAAYVVGDNEAPPMWLGARVSTLKKQLDAGILLTLTRNELTDVVWDPNRAALSAAPASAKLRVPKFHLQYQTPRWHLVAGTFRIGFGQRLVLDNTNRYNPNGIHVDDQIYYNRDVASECREASGEVSEAPCPLTEPASYETPDFRWPERFRGVALGLKSLSVGSGWLQAYAFASLNTKRIYQYELFDRSRCADPRANDDPDCAAPYVFKRQPGDPLAPTTRFKSSTLPDMFNELVGGGNASWFFSRRAHIGVTGYGANVYWLPSGAPLDFQESARLPFGGAFGAFGVDAAWGWRWLDLFAEVARGFDHQPERGGWAAIGRATVNFRKQELELSGRYYDAAYGNPFARPISGIDEYEGLRASNEAGARLRYIGQVGDLDVRSLFDLWWNLRQTSGFDPVTGSIVTQQAAAPKIRFRTNLQYEIAWWFRPSVWVDVFDKDVRENGRGLCFTTPFEEVEGEPVPCTGMRAQFGAQLKFLPRRGLTLSLRYVHKILDDRKYPDGFRQDVNAWLTVAWTPRDWLTLRMRLRYLSEDLANRASLEESVWTYLESIFIVKRTLRIKGRYEVYAWIDQRASTALRTPNPAHWLRFELEYRF